VKVRVRVVPEKHEVEVELTLEGLDPNLPLDLNVPIWVPGAYGFMKYGRDLFDFRARNAKTGANLPLERRGWSGFRIAEPASSVVIEHKASAADSVWGELVGIIGSENAVLLATHFLVPAGHVGPCRVDYELPERWDLHHPSGARALGPRPGDLPATSFEYPSFAVLLDTPVIAGKFKRETRVSEGVHFHHVFVDDAVGFAAESSAFIDSVMHVAEAARAIFGSYPFEDYTFIYSFDPRAHWGLEHANSTMLGIGPNVFIDAEARLSAIRVAGHEILHAWNVCRLRPKPLNEPDLVNGSFPDGLWVSEGFTRYYEFLLAVRAKEMTPARFFSNVVNYFKHLSAIPAYARVSAKDSSLTTFLNHNRYPGSVNNTIDYYDKGMLIAFDMDVAFRTASPASSLDLEFKAFYEAYLPSGFSSEDAVSFFAGRAVGMGELLKREVDGPGGLSVSERLTSLGFEVKLGKRRRLGIHLKENTGPSIINVLDTSPAGESGLAPEDEIVKTNGFVFSLPALTWLIANEPEVILEVKRGHVYRAIRVHPEDHEEITALIWRGTPAQLARIREWLALPDFTLAPGEEISLSFYDNFHGVENIL
jgi:predicted metalloprotease with PDZ domain